MDKTDKIILGVALAALIAIIAYAHKDEITDIGRDLMSSNTTTSKKGGPWYLTYNQTVNWGDPGLSMMPFASRTTNANAPNKPDNFEAGALYENW